MHLRTFLKLFDLFYDVMFFGESLLDMKILYYDEEASYFSGVGAPEKALESYRKALALDPDNFYVHTGLAYFFAKQREFQRALEHADLAFKSKTPEVVRSSRIYLNFLRLVIFQMLERSDEAKAVLDKLLVSLEGRLSLVYNRLANFYFEFRIYEKAAYYYKETITLRPKEPAFRQYLALAYAADGKPEKARVSLMEARQLAKSKRQGRAIERQIRKIALG